MNAGIAAVLVVWLEGHFLTIVAADGVDIKPIQVRISRKSTPSAAVGVDLRLSRDAKRLDLCLE